MRLGASDADLELCDDFRPNTSPVFISAIALAARNKSVWSHFFGLGCRAEDRCFDQIVFTMPFYASAAYSLGALLARRMGRKSGEEIATAETN
jgi:hypothetical protein